MAQFSVKIISLTGSVLGENQQSAYLLTSTCANPVAKAINYMFEEDGRWEAFTRFLDDGRICLTNNAAERALRGVALEGKAWLFAGSSRGGDRAAFMYSLIVTAKMNTEMNIYHCFVCDPYPSIDRATGRAFEDGAWQGQTQELAISLS